MKLENITFRMLFKQFDVRLFSFPPFKMFPGRRQAFRGSDFLEKIKTSKPPQTVYYFLYPSFFNTKGVLKLLIVRLLRNGHEHKEWHGPDTSSSRRPRRCRDSSSRSPH